MGVAYVRFAVAHPSHYRVMFGADVTERRDAELAHEGAGAFQVLVDALDRSSSTTGWRGATIRMQMALFVWATVHGVAMLAIDGRLEHQNADVEERDPLRDRADAYWHCCGPSVSHVPLPLPPFPSLPFPSLPFPLPLPLPLPPSPLPLPLSRRSHGRAGSRPVETARGHGAYSGREAQARPEIVVCRRPLNSGILFSPLAFWAREPGHRAAGGVTAITGFGPDSDRTRLISILA